jgi:anti-sigma B factor antagonist
MLAALALKMHNEGGGKEAMSHVKENTIVQLLSRGEICVPAAGHPEHLPAPSLQMIYKVVHRPNTGPVWILRVMGGVDSRTSGELLAKIERLLGANHISRLVLDLDGVGHMDSSGVGALLAGLRVSQRQHVKFTLCGLGKSVHHLLERTRLSGLFEIWPTVEEALRR